MKIITYIKFFTIGLFIFRKPLSAFVPVHPAGPVCSAGCDGIAANGRPSPHPRPPNGRPRVGPASRGTAAWPSRRSASCATLSTRPATRP